MIEQVQISSIMLINKLYFFRESSLYFYVSGYRFHVFTTFKEMSPSVVIFLEIPSIDLFTSRRNNVWRHIFALGPYWLKRRSPQIGKCIWQMHFLPVQKQTENWRVIPLQFLKSIIDG